MDKLISDIADLPHQTPITCEHCGGPADLGQIKSSSAGAKSKMWLYECPDCHHQMIRLVAD